VDRGDAMITDGRAYLDDVVSQMQEDYKKNGAVAVTQYGSFQVGGRDVAAVDMQYRNKSGVKIYLLLAIDVRERCSVIYSVRYLDQSQRQKMLDGLELIASNMRFDEDQAAADPDAQIGSPAPASGAQADPARPGDPAPYSWPSPTSPRTTTRWGAASPRRTRRSSGASFPAPTRRAIPTPAASWRPRAPTTASS